VRERWFGATGRRVPEIAVEGELDLGDALVLDRVGTAEELEAAHEVGRPIVVRASSAAEVKSALAHPEVAVALVPADRRELLELDLRELTYGP
jgi:uridine phosphorylase